MLSPPVRDREQMLRLVEQVLRDAGPYPFRYKAWAERIVDALLPQPDPETARPDSWRRERDRALLRAERAEERLREVTDAASAFVDHIEYWEHLPPEARLQGVNEWRPRSHELYDALRAVLSGQPDPGPALNPAQERA